MTATLIEVDAWPIEWIVYERKSQAKDGSTVGVDRQDREITRRIVGMEGSVIERVIENDRSASEYAKKPRPEWTRLVDEIADGKHRGRGLACWDQDRLSRVPIQLEQLWIACQAGGIDHVISTQGDLNIAKGYDLMMARVKAAVHAEESRKQSERWMSLHRELAELGATPGGKPGYGFRAVRVMVPERNGPVTTLEVEPAEADRIREAAARVLAGDSIRSITKDWNARGIPAAEGGIWKPQVLRRILLADRTGGIRTHRPAAHTRHPGEVTQRKALWPAILDQRTHRLVKLILEDPARRLTTAPTRVHLLAGVLICGRCGTPMPSRNHGTDRRSYACIADRGGCAGVRVVAEPVDEEVIGQILGRLDRRRQADADAGREDVAAREAEAERAEVEALMAARIIERDQGAIEEFEFRASRADLMKRHAAATAQLVAAQKAAGSLVRISAVTDRASWESLSIDQQRALIADVTRRIEVMPVSHGPRFRPERIRITWRA